MIQALVIGLIMTTSQVCTTPPVITINGYSPVYIDCNNPYNEAGATAWSACPGVGDLSPLVVIDNSAVNTRRPGTYIVFYTVTDPYGNVGMAQRTVIVPDIFEIAVHGAVSAPTLPGIGKVYVTPWECSLPYDDPGATATDACDNDDVLTRQMTIVGVDQVLPGHLTDPGVLQAVLSGVLSPMDAPGVFLINYSVTNSRNQTIMANRVVYIRDSLEPVISLHGVGETPTTRLEPDAPDPLWWEECLEEYESRYPNPQFTLPTRWRVREEWDNEVDPLMWHCRVPNYIDPGARADDSCQGVLNPDDIVLVLTRYWVGEGGPFEVFQYVARMGDYARFPLPKLNEDPTRNYWLGYRAYYLVRDRSGNPFENSNWRTLRSRLIEPFYRIGLTGVSGTTVLQCHQPFDPGAGVRAYDLCEGDITSRIEIQGTVTTDQPGIYFIRYDVWNNYGTHVHTTRRIEVVDEDGPEITLLDENSDPAVTPVTVIPWCALRDNGVEWWEEEDGWFALRPYQGWRASDLCDDNDILTTRVALQGKGVLRNALEFLASTRDQQVDPAAIAARIKAYELVHNVSDGSYNQATPAVRIVNVVRTYPDIVLTGDALIVHECGDPYVDLLPTNAEVCDTDMLIVGGDAYLNAQGNYTINVHDPRDHVITYRIINAIQEEDYAERIVRVQDTLAPVVSIIPKPGTDYVINPYLEWEPGVPLNPSLVVSVTAFDRCDGELAVEQDWGDLNFESPAPGRYYIRYSATDRTGNVGLAILRIDISVEDEEGEGEGEDDLPRPVVTLLGPNPMTIECAEGFADPGAVATDELDGTLLATANTQLEDERFIPEKYEIHYSATNRLGRTGVAVRQVIVEDSVPPLIDLRGEPRIDLDIGERFIDPGYSAQDKCDRDVIVVVTGTVDTGKAGVYTLTYEATDASGNSADPVTRKVGVGQTTPQSDMEGEIVDPRDGEAPGEGETSADDGQCGCVASEKSLLGHIRSFFADYILLGVSLLALMALGYAQKQD